jgi:hypothetical protein
MKCVNCSKETNNPKFCCRSCSASFTNRTHPKRRKQPRILQCKHCQKKYNWYRSRNKVYCSKECYLTYKDHQIESTGYFNAVWNGNKPIRNYLIKKYGNNCMICGQSGDNWHGKPMTLIVDHIDGKADNYAVSNIRIICHNCDSQLPTYKGRNKGNSTRKYTISQK